MYIYICIYNKYSVWRSSYPEEVSLKRTPKNTTKSTGEHAIHEVALQRGRSNINKSPKAPSKSTPKGLHPLIFKNPN